jgi:hypothetical protein
MNMLGGLRKGWKSDCCPKGSEFIQINGGEVSGFHSFVFCIN